VIILGVILLVIGFVVIHQVEASVPGQDEQLADRRLDVGRAALATPGIASLLFRRDPSGDLIPAGHRFAGLDAVPIAVLATEPLLLAEEARAPEFNQFTVEMCRSAGFTPVVYAAALVTEPLGSSLSSARTARLRSAGAAATGCARAAGMQPQRRAPAQCPMREMKRRVA